MGTPILSPRERRAVMLAPLVAPAAYATGLLMAGAFRALSEGDSRVFFRPLLVFGMSFGIGAPIAYLAMGLLGLPAYLLLRRMGRAGRVALWLAGATAGAAVAALMQPSLRGELFSIPLPVWSGSLLGLVTAETFVRLRDGTRGGGGGTSGSPRGEPRLSRDGRRRGDDDEQRRP